MPDRFSQRVEEALAKTAEALADGFDATDVSVIVREAVETAEAFDDLNGPEKRKLAINFASALIDKFFQSSTPSIEKLVEKIDWPLLPDSVEAAVIDPWVKKLAVPFARDLVKSAIPSLVDLAVDASKGKLKLN